MFGKLIFSNQSNNKIFSKYEIIHIMSKIFLKIHKNILYFQTCETFCLAQDGYMPKSLAEFAYLFEQFSIINGMWVNSIKKTITSYLMFLLIKPTNILLQYLTPIVKNKLLIYILSTLFKKLLG